MRPVFFVFYGLMALWLLAAAVLRVVLSLRDGVPLDVLPALTGAIGLFALLIAVPRAVRWISGRRPRPRTAPVMVPVPPSGTAHRADQDPEG